MAGAVGHRAVAAVPQGREAGWHSLIPILNAYDEFDICWKGGKAFLCYLLLAVSGALVAAGQDDPFLMIGALVCLLWLISLHWRQSMWLARSFGKGWWAGLFLFLFDRLGRVILGLSGAQYVGKSR